MSDKRFFNQLQKNLLKFSKQGNIDGVIQTLTSSFDAYPSLNLESEFIAIADTISKQKLFSHRHQSILGLISAAALFGIEGFEDQINRINSQTQFTRPDYKPDDELLMSVKSGDIPGIMKALSEGAGINARTSKGKTSLHHAIHHEYTDIVRVLLENGAKIDALDNQRATALHYSSLMYYENTVKLINAGADIHCRDKTDQTPLHYAARGTEPRNLELLVSKGAKINAKDSRGQTPLHIATLKALPWQLEALISLKPNLHIRDAEGYRPIYLAKKLRYDEKVEIIESAIKKKPQLQILRLWQTLIKSR